MHLKIVAQDQLIGPLPLEVLVEMAANGEISPQDLVRPGGSQAWIRVTEVPELAARLAVPPAPDPFGADPPDDLPEAGDARDLFEIGRGTPHEEAAMEMAPMIDVTFLLLIFFMLTNSLANPAAMEVPDAVHGRGVTLEGQQLILVDQEGRYYLGDAATEQSAVDSLDALVREVGDNVAASRQTLDVIVSAHRHSKHRYVRELVEGLSALEDLGNIQIGVEEKLN
jgi:biopolymer transport protein ExbD